MKILNFFVILSFIILIHGCEKYNDYVEDYNYTTVYFGTQKPLRTVVARDPMQIKFGVTLGGIRENTNDHWVRFRIEPDLLKTVSGASHLTLLPQNYYKMELPSSDSLFVIQKGKTIGDVVLKINKEIFCADPLALTNTYALPLRIYETSADSILSGNEVTSPKDYTIIVIKYISQESGTYYVKGSETNQSTGLTNSYNYSDLIKNKTRDLITLSLNQLEMGGIGSRNVSDKNKLIISLSENDNVTLSSIEGGVTITDLGSSYDADKRIFSLKYTYTDNSNTFTVTEEIIQRNDPESDLRFEEW
ncbi:MAG: DUF1735 domain-containing protein [Parabacteroides sp.]|nr:DUF1735 domain-containing protein [Parabacteroides sp.]